MEEVRAQPFLTKLVSVRSKFIRQRPPQICLQLELQAWLDNTTIRQIKLLLQRYPSISSLNEKLLFINHRTLYTV